MKITVHLSSNEFSMEAENKDDQEILEKIIRFAGHSTLKVMVSTSRPNEIAFLQYGFPLR